MMEWGQILAVIASNVGMFLWARSESRADHRQLANSTNSILQAIREDMKDFHGRLCAIEERNRK